MKRKIILLLNEYPYGVGEYSFIKTELEYLLKEYELVIISFSKSQNRKMHLDHRITLYHCINRFGFIEKIYAVIKFIFSRVGWHELKEILKDKKDIAGRIYDSIAYYGCALQISHFVHLNKIIPQNENIIIYSYWFNEACLAFLLKKRRYNNYKVISRIHGYDLYNERKKYGRQPFRSYMNEEVDKLFFVGDSGFDYYSKHWNVISQINKYLIAPIGTENNSTMDNIIIPNKNFMRVVSCSDVIPLKRISLIIHALSEISDMDIEWIHFGDGVQMEELQQTARKVLGNKKNIKYHFYGYVPIQDIMNYYEKNFVDCFISTSATEGAPVSIQEAMSYGIPIIATAVGEIPNMIKGNGLLLSANPTLEEIKDALEILWNMQGQEKVNLRIESRKLWREKYDARKNAQNFVKELHDIM